MKRNPTRGWDENKYDNEDIPISLKLMRHSTTYTYTLNGPYPGVKKVSKAIRNKRP